MTLYSPFDAHPGQQWSNLRSKPLVIVQEDQFIFARPAVLIRCEPQNIRVRIPLHEHPSHAADSRERFENSFLQSLAVPATFSNAGPSGRNQIFGAVYRLLRAFPSLLNSSQEPSSGIRKCFQSVLRFVAHGEQLSMEAKAKWTEIFSLRGVK